MLSDLENMDVMLDCSHFERNLDQIDSLNSQSNESNTEIQHFKSVKSNANLNENAIRKFAGNG